jgi:hypothetical protein
VTTGASTEELRLFIPITKIDEEKRLVYGTVTEEVMDKSGEMFDYATSKPYFEKWSAEISKATNGKSVGNLRVMHTSKAAGKLVSLDLDDADKRISCAAKVVDDDEWKKCLEGVYTGFSQGGRYVRRWKDEGGSARYTAEPSEVSIVDNPCLGTAHFQLAKADGTVEDREFKSKEVESGEGRPEGGKAEGTELTGKQDGGDGERTGDGQSGSDGAGGGGAEVEKSQAAPHVAWVETRTPWPFN